MSCVVSKNARPELRAQLAQAVPDRVPGAWIEPDRRLVEEEHRRAVQHRLGDLQPTNHPSRVGAHELRATSAKAHEGERLVDPLASRPAAGLRIAAPTA